MSRTLTRSRVLLGLAAVVVIGLIYWAGPTWAPSPRPVTTPTVSPAPTLTPSAQPSNHPDYQKVSGDWEEMFRTTQSYEYVRANGKLDDKAWWVEQYERFYTGTALARQLETIQHMFRPGAFAPAFIADARYTLEVTGCASAVKCTLQVNVQSGTYWAYHVRSKSWNKANPVEAFEWTVAMRYDPAAERWKIE